MAQQMNVFPECNVDTNLVVHILGGYVKHKSTCNEVVKAVNKSDDFAVGVIDADKRQATMDAGFHEYALPQNVDGLSRHVRFFIHDDRKRFIFTVYKAMDSFIFNAAMSQKANMSAFGNPKNVDEFLAYTKNVQAETDPKLRKLFNEIKDYPELMCFRNTLKYLLAKKYKVDIGVAKQFFDGTLGKDNLPDYL